MNSQMSDENLAQFMSAFARLKERVVWKWEAGDRDLKALGLSDNVYVSSWLPQHAVVAHPNVRAAVIHGGIRSMQEMLCYGKPQVTVPVFGDQPANGLYAKSRGYGEMVPFATLDEEELFTAIRCDFNSI
jgi:glucuronosyltransferase